MSVSSLRECAPDSETEPAQASQQFDSNRPSAVFLLHIDHAVVSFFFLLFVHMKADLEKQT